MSEIYFDESELPALFERMGLNQRIDLSRERLVASEHLGRMASVHLTSDGVFQVFEGDLDHALSVLAKTSPPRDVARMLTGLADGLGGADASMLNVGPAAALASRLVSTLIAGLRDRSPHFLRNALAGLLTGGLAKFGLVSQIATELGRGQLTEIGLLVSRSRTRRDGAGDERAVRESVREMIDAELSDRGGSAPRTPDIQGVENSR